MDGNKEDLPQCRCRNRHSGNEELWRAHLCVAIAELRVGNGAVKALPKSDDDTYANSAPGRSVSGPNMREGVMVGPPRKQE